MGKALVHEHLADRLPMPVDGAQLSAVLVLISETFSDFKRAGIQQPTGFTR